MTTCNLLTLGGWAGKAFPYSEGAGDVTISGATTWSDSAGFKRVGVLTIDSGQVLTIARSPFFIFANEIVFGSTTSQISGDGPSGASSGTFSSVYAIGGTATSGSARAQGGCGGILLIIVCNKISGAAGLITVNGGNGFRNTTNASTMTRSQGRGAFSSKSTQQLWITYPMGRFMSGYGGTSHGAGGGSGGGGGAVGGGSGFGSGSSLNGVGTARERDPNLQQIVDLAKYGCLGGGGGGAEVSTTGTNNSAGGGGGGGLAVVARTLAVTPTLQANGGTGANTVNGGSGVTILMELG